MTAGCSLSGFRLFLSSNAYLHTQLSVSKDFSMFLDVPLHLVRGEEIVLEVHIINHLEHDIEVSRTGIFC